MAAFLSPFAAYPSARLSQAFHEFGNAFVFFWNVAIARSTCPAPRYWYPRLFRCPSVAISSAFFRSSAAAFASPFLSRIAAFVMRLAPFSWSPIDLSTQVVARSRSPPFATSHCAAPFHPCQLKRGRPRSCSARSAETVATRSTSIFTGRRSFSHRSVSAADESVTSSNV